MNPSQSTTILRDVTVNINRQLSSRPTTTIDQTKSRSKSLSTYNNNNNNNNKRYLEQNENVNPINRSKPMKQQSKQYTVDKYQPQNTNNPNNYPSNNNNKIYSLWSIPILAEEDTLTTNKQSIGTSISNQIISIAQNQHSYLILQTNNMFKAISKQNNIENQTLTNTVNNFFINKSIKLQQIHATTFGTFFIDNHNLLYAMGLNDRGQLGIKSTNIITQPTEVALPFSYSVSNSKPKSSSLLLKNKPITTVLQKQKQKITKIQGGPFYTVILTTFNKAYYSGMSYEDNDLQNDQYINTFKQLTIKNDPIIIDIACGLTSTILLTSNNKIYLMGIFGDNVFPHPTELQFSIRAQIKQCKTVNDSVYLLLKNGQLYKADMNRKMPIITEIKLGQLINNNYKDIDQKQRKIVVEYLHVTNNQLIFATKQYMNKQNTSFSYKYFIQIKNNQNQQNQIQDQIKQLHLPQLEGINIKQIFIISSHLNILIKCEQSQKLIQKQKSFSQKILINKKQIDSYMIKIKQLQQENLKLKKENIILTKQKKLTTPKKQDKLTLSNINYNFQKQVTPRSFNNDLEIEFSQIKLTKKIAQGGYGIIYKGEWKKTEVAVKIFKIDQNNTNSVKQFVSQCRAMQALRHPNIVMFLGICMKKPNFAIVLQYCQGGTLWSLLQNHKIDLPWKERVRLAIQTAKSINYLHDRKNPIVHRDLKSLNVLLDANRRVKLADFGWTKSLQSYMTSKIGTYQWMAPQVLTGQKYSEKADVFSFSIILWEIASRQPPYRNINGIQVAYDVANKQYRPTIPNGTPEFFQKLITSCWEKDPQKRPSFKEIIEILDKQFNSMN